MKMKGRKVTSFFICNAELLLVFFFSLFFAKEILNIIGISIVCGFITNTVIFIGGNTYDKWIKSKYYKEELDDRQN